MSRVKGIIVLCAAILLLCGGASAEEYVLQLYQPIPYEDHTPWRINPGQEMAQRFAAEKSWDAVMVSCPSFNNNTGDLTLSVYRWEKDYASSVQASPVVQQKFVNFMDNASLRVFLQEPQPAGEYLLVLNQAREQVGVWLYFQGTYAGQCYLNGEPVRGNFEARVLYVMNEGPITVPDEYLTPPTEQ